MGDAEGKDEPQGTETAGGEMVPTREAEAEPPQISPPKTKAPVQFNQQVNVYQQIPPSAWDRLSADQVVDLSKEILRVMDATDSRQFQYAMDQAKRGDTSRTRTTIAGTVITVIAFGLTAYLAIAGHEIIAMSISLPLATILAIVVGNKIVGGN